MLQNLYITNNVQRYILLATVTASNNEISTLIEITIVAIMYHTSLEITIC